MSKLAEIRAFINNFDWVDDGPKAKAIIQAVVDQCEKDCIISYRLFNCEAEGRRIKARAVIDAMYGVLEDE